MNQPMRQQQRVEETNKNKEQTELIELMKEIEPEIGKMKVEIDYEEMKEREKQNEAFLKRIRDYTSKRLRQMKELEEEEEGKTTEERAFNKWKELLKRKEEDTNNKSIEQEMKAFYEKEGKEMEESIKIAIHFGEIEREMMEGGVHEEKLSTYAETIKKGIEAYGASIAYWEYARIRILPIILHIGNIAGKEKQMEVMRHIIEAYKQTKPHEFYGRTTLLEALYSIIQANKMEIPAEKQQYYLTYITSIQMEIIHTIPKLREALNKTLCETLKNEKYYYMIVKRYVALNQGQHNMDPEDLNTIHKIVEDNKNDGIAHLILSGHYMNSNTKKGIEHAEMAARSVHQQTNINEIFQHVGTTEVPLSAVGTYITLAMKFVEKEPKRALSWLKLALYYDPYFSPYLFSYAIQAVTANLPEEKKIAASIDYILAGYTFHPDLFRQTMEALEKQPQFKMLVPRPSWREDLAKANTLFLEALQHTASKYQHLRTKQDKEHHLKDIEFLEEMNDMYNVLPKYRVLALKLELQLELAQPVFLVDVKKLAEQYPRCIETNILVANCYLKSKKPENALTHIDRVLQAAPYNMQGIILGARCFLALKRYDDAMILIERILSYDCAHPDALILSSMILKEQGHVEKALASLNKVCSMERTSSYPFILRSILHAARRDHESQLNDLHHVMYHFPKDPDPYPLIIDYYTNIEEDAELASQYRDMLANMMQ